MKKNSRLQQKIWAFVYKGFSEPGRQRPFFILLVGDSWRRISWLAMVEYDTNMTRTEQLFFVIVVDQRCITYRPDFLDRLEFVFIRNWQSFLKLEFIWQTLHKGA